MRAVLWGLAHALWGTHSLLPPHSQTSQPHSQPEHPTCDALLENSVASWQCGIFVSSFPLTTLPPSSSGLFLLSSAHHSLLLGLIPNGPSLVHAEKILSLCTFQQNYQPKKFREKNNSL